MELSRARYLVSSEGRAALGSLPESLDALDVNRLGAALRKDFAPAEAAALAEQVTLRRKAKERFGGETPGFLWTADGLEMMTHPAVARRRAERLALLGLTAADLTCGLGGDLAAVAHTGTNACGLERDRATALLAAANVPRAGIARGDAARPPFDVSRLAVVLDPSRRAAAGRRFDPAAFSPPWGTAIGILQQARAGVMKAPPGIEHRHVPPAAELEFVQYGRSMREAAVWLGAGAEPGLRRAVLLPEGVELRSDEPEAPPGPAAPGAILFDPESCVTRAGVVRQLAHRLAARLMDPHVAYLAANEAVFHPLCATFEVLEALPFSVARLKALLRERRWRPDEIRRRAFPVEPDELRRLLGRMEGEPVALLLTTLGRKRMVFVCRRVWPETAATNL